MGRIGGLAACLLVEIDPRPTLSGTELVAEIAIYRWDVCTKDSLILGKITFDNDVSNVRKFLQSTPLRKFNSDEYAAQFLARGLDAAMIISNSFNAQFGLGYKPVTDLNYGQDKGGSYKKYLAPLIPRAQI